MCITKRGKRGRGGHQPFFLALCNHTSTAHGNLRKGLLTRAIPGRGQEHDKAAFFLFFPVLQGFRYQEANEGMKNWKEQGVVGAFFAPTPVLEYSS